MKYLRFSTSSQYDIVYCIGGSKQGPGRQHVGTTGGASDRWERWRQGHLGTGNGLEYSGAARSHGRRQEICTTEAQVMKQPEIARNFILVVI